MRGGYQAGKGTLYGQCKPKLRYSVRRLHKVISFTKKIVQQKKDK